jgi:hypothetical protein
MTRRYWDTKTILAPHKSAHKPAFMAAKVCICVMWCDRRTGVGLLEAFTAVEREEHPRRLGGHHLDRRRLLLLCLLLDLIRLRQPRRLSTHDTDLSTSRHQGKSEVASILSLASEHKSFRGGSLTNCGGASSSPSPSPSPPPPPASSPASHTSIPSPRASCCQAGRPAAVCRVALVVCHAPSGTSSSASISMSANGSTVSGSRSGSSSAWRGRGTGRPEGWH